MKEIIWGDHCSQPKNTLYFSFPHTWLSFHCYSPVLWFLTAGGSTEQPCAMGKELLSLSFSSFPSSHLNCPSLQREHVQLWRLHRNQALLKTPPLKAYLLRIILFSPPRSTWYMCATKIVLQFWHMKFCFVFKNLWLKHGVVIVPWFCLADKIPTKNICFIWILIQ